VLVQGVQDIAEDGEAVFVTEPAFGRVQVMEAGTYASPPPLSMTRPPTSAAGVLALLDEEDDDLKRHALKSLNPLVPQFWAEISERLTTLYIAQYP
jgi:hypothetical protein